MTLNYPTQTSEKWWLCTDGVDTGYLPPDCLLITQQREVEDGEYEEEGEVDIVDLDIISILKSESEDDTSRSSRWGSTFSDCFEAIFRSISSLLFVLTLSLRF